MGLFLIIFVVIALVFLFISRLKISKLQKILWSLAALSVIFFFILYLFTQGFERGRNQLVLPDEELHQPIK